MDSVAKCVNKQNSTGLVLMTTSAIAVAAAIVATYYLPLNKDSLNLKEQFTNYYSQWFCSKKVEELPAISEHDAEEIMTDILNKFTALVPQFHSDAVNFKANAVAQGIPESEIDEREMTRVHILPYVNKAYRDIQDSVLKKFDWDDDELEEGVDYYICQGNKKLRNVSNKIHLIFRAFNGEDFEEGIPVDQIIIVLTEMVNLMPKVTDKVCREFVMQYGPPKSDMEMQMFTIQLMGEAERAEKSILEPRKYDPTEFHSALKKNQKHKEIIELIAQIQADRTRIFAQYGF